MNETKRGYARCCARVPKGGLGSPPHRHISEVGGVNEVTPIGKSVSVSVRVVRAGEAKLREFHP